MDALPRSGRLLRFGLFQLELSTGELTRNGRRIPLQEQPFRILKLLLERPAQLIAREELQQKLWPADTFVDFDDGLNAAMKKLRQALGDSADHPIFIETIPRRGYRFIAPVSTIDNQLPAASTPVERPEITTPSRDPQRTWLAALLLLVVILAGSSVAVNRSDRKPNEATPIRSLVVLPLKNLSNDPEQQYFADGMTEELITRLASLDGLRVISRTSAMKFRDTDKLLPQIASELKVDAVVTGSVLHSENRVRITAQLLHAASDRHLWAESYERDERDVLDLQNEVANRIAEKISLKLQPQTAALTRRTHPIDPEAHRAYLRGRYRWHTRQAGEMMRAVADFERAIAIQPDYALAHAGLADVYLVLPFLSWVPHDETYPKAKLAAEKALALDPTLAEAHTSSAYVKMYLDWDFAGAERGFRRAIELNPNYATAHQWYSELLSFQRRHEEALAELQVALELDPLAPIMHHQAGQGYQIARRYDQAVQEYQNAMALDPKFAAAGHGMANAYARAGLLKEAARQFRQTFRDTHLEKPIFALADVAETGDTRAFYLQQLETAKHYIRPTCHFATYNAALRRDDEAFYWLNKAYQERNECILYMNVDPEWDPLRSDPRFLAILDKVGIARVREGLRTSAR